MNIEIICGDIFIVPNSLQAIGEYEHNTNFLISEYDGSIIIRGERVRPKNGDLFAQVWVTGNGSSSWDDHGTPGFEDRVLFPGDFPVNSLEGLREGDSFEMKFNGKMFRLTCRQNDYRYWECGNFQTALKRLVERYHETHK